MLNLRHSYKYRSLTTDYLIAKQTWDTHREAYLQRAELTTVAAGSRPSTRSPYSSISNTSRRIGALVGDNPYVHFRKDGSFHVSTPQAEPEDSESLRGVFPKRRYVSLLEVLATVNRFAHFLEAIGGSPIPAPAARPDLFCGDYRLRLLHWDPQDRQHFVRVFGSGAGKYGQRVLHAGQYPWGE